MVEAVPVRHGMVLGGRYAIDKIIGRGGSGVVVRAHDRDLREVVAIKIVRAELAGQRVWAERLAREVRLARQIQHPHVCRVFDFQQADARVFLVMELAENGTLRDELRSGALAARPLAERIADARAVASALAAIHGAGIVHRDLTPQNMLRMGDGRLVLSDFGLAIDVSESTSVHGGTIAYMAPEVLRGGHSSFASDMWALGVVMHEIVFGVKPLWSDGAVPEILAPRLGRKLTEEERAVLEACRACTAKEPARRIASAAEAGRMLTERRRWRARLRAVSRRPVIVAAAVTVVAAVGVWRARPKAPVAPSTTAVQSPLIVPTGEPADWTDVSTVLVEVPELIQCARLLPDKRTIRFVWGSPPRAEDIDTVTRKRVPSPLQPAAYAEGCPDVSPDGKRLVYQGHAKDGRAVAFLSQHPDGKDAVPVVQTAEPSMSSEPLWLADGQTFSYDIDNRHAGVFSTSANRMYVLPETTPDSSGTIFRSVIGNRVMVASWDKNLGMELAGFLVPQLKNDVRFRVSEWGVDFAFDGSRFYFASQGPRKREVIVAVDLAEHSARKIGGIRQQSVRQPLFTEMGLFFLSKRDVSDLFVRDENGKLRRVTNGERIVSAKPCGDDLVISKRDGERAIVERIDRRGTTLKVLSSGPDASATCSPDGRVWCYSHSGPPVSIRRCNDLGCRDLVVGGVAFPYVSPDGRRVAFVEFELRAPIVKWISIDGGEVHEVSETETGCPAGWASPKTLWVSRRYGSKIVWKEVDADSGRETGKSVPGSRDCTDGGLDPASPIDPDLRIISDRTSQLRLIERERLN